MDFFTVPRITFGVLYGFFIIGHDRRRILHFNVTRHPTSAWIVQPLREAFPYQSAPKFLIFDRDAKYGWDVPAAIRSIKIAAAQTAIRSPWQNGVAERWVGSCRRELLDHVIGARSEHLKRLLFEYVSYYHHDRTHLGLEDASFRVRFQLWRGTGDSEPAGLHSYKITFPFQRDRVIGRDRLMKGELVRHEVHECR